MPKGAPDNYRANIEITRVNGKPALQVRKVFTKTDDIKSILARAFDDQEIIFRAGIVNKHLAIIKLAEYDLLEEEYL